MGIIVTFNPDIHHRRSIRLTGYDYGSSGAYFVTVCAWRRECLFGEIEDGVMVLNDYGRIVQTEWLRSAEIRKEIALDEFIIMPNHFHGIVVIENDVGATRWVAHGCDNIDERATHRVAPTGPVSGSIGAIIGQFKSISSRRINAFRDNPGCPVWQRNYYERVIRNDRELAAIREYIAANPSQWALDRENPANQTV
jgi:REP element-mobilizing transposase RayT